MDTEYGKVVLLTDRLLFELLQEQKRTNDLLEKLIEKKPTRAKPTPTKGG